jgi:hypothetical protein
VMVHLCDSEAWQALDNFDPNFAKDARNVRIGLAIDGFTPYNSFVASYSSWHIFAIPYNLPPALYMKYEYCWGCGEETAGNPSRSPTSHGLTFATIALIGFVGMGGIT